MFTFTQALLSLRCHHVSIALSPLVYNWYLSKNFVFEISTFWDSNLVLNNITAHYRVANLFNFFNWSSKIMDYRLMITHLLQSCHFISCACQNIFFCHKCSENPWESNTFYEVILFKVIIPIKMALFSNFTIILKFL